MRTIFVLISLIVFSSISEAQQKVPILTPVKEPVSFREDLIWNKWDTENFIILSLDKKQGLDLRDSVEKIRTEFLNSWGIESQNSTVKCKLICVPDQQFLSKFFNINAPHCEVRYDSSGNVSVCAIWIDYNRLDNLSSLVGSISISVLPRKMNPAIRQGVVALSATPESIRALLGSSSEVDTKTLFTTDINSAKDKDDYKRKSALLCLMLRREFGKDNFAAFMQSQQGEDQIRSFFGFSGHEELSKTLSRYSKHLSNDIIGGKTPDKYLIIR